MRKPLKICQTSLLLVCISLHFSSSYGQGRQKTDGDDQVGVGEGEDSFRFNWSTLSFRAVAHPLVESAFVVPDHSLLNKLHFLFL